MRAMKGSRAIGRVGLLAGILLGGFACAQPEPDLAPRQGLVVPSATAASSIDRQRSFIRKQNLQSRERVLEDRWQSGNPDRSERSRDPRERRQDFDQRDVFDDLQGTRSGLQDLGRQR